MADFTSETVTRTVRRWIIPCAEPWGAAAAEIGKAWSAAASAYLEARGLPEDTTLPDNALRFHVTDDEIVIEYQTEEPTP